MESLLDQADAAAAEASTNGTGGPALPPSLVIPKSLLPLTTPNDDTLEIGENPNKGKGWYAKRPISAGTVLLVAKPIAMVLDLEEDDDDTSDDLDVDKEDMEDSEEEEQGSTINEMLVLKVLHSIVADPLIWTQQLSFLYPRDVVDIEASPVWIPKNASILDQYRTLIKQIESIPALEENAKEISQRLPWIIRYNVLSIETCPELLSHPSIHGHSPLSGAGLYYWPSFFNHDARPNVSRYAVGDVMWFVTNQDVAGGLELCISYLEHDVLGEPPRRRNGMLKMNFKEDEDAFSSINEKGDGPDAPVVDNDVQDELMELNPFERLEAIETLMKQAAGETLPEEEVEGIDEDEDGMDTRGEAWCQCDSQNLRILKAITLEAMGMSDKALLTWGECINFTETQMPPNDEASIVMRVQAALCSLKLKQEDAARHHASIALQRHHLLFGGGIARFRRRYRPEFRLNLRSQSDFSGGIRGQSPEDFLWPLDNK